MTVPDDVQGVFADLEMNRGDARIAAKSLAQTIIDDSSAGQTPLTGVVYAVSGLYNEGVPECTFTTDDEAVVFSGEFRTESGDVVTKRRRVSPSTLRALVDESPPNPRP